MERLKALRVVFISTIVFFNKETILQNTAKNKWFFGCATGSSFADGQMAVAIAVPWMAFSTCFFCSLGGQLFLGFFTEDRRGTNVEKQLLGSHLPFLPSQEPCFICS